MLIGVHREFWLPILFVESLAGVFVFGYSMKRRPRFWFRLALALLSGCLVVQLLGTKLWEISSAARLLTISLLYLFLILVVWFSWAETVWTAVFVAASGYIAQDITTGIRIFLQIILNYNQYVVGLVGKLVLELVCFGAIYSLLYFVFLPYTRQREEIYDNKVKAIFSVVVLLVCAGMARVTADVVNRDPRAVIVEGIYQLMSGCFILTLQYSIMGRNHLVHYVEVMQELVHQQHTQYELSRENVQFINEKYHDLRKLLEDLRWNVSYKQLEALERQIDSYDIAVHTGNAVLDIILPEKRALCAQKNILFTCSVQKISLDFMESLDLYTLINNALTNAIEAAEKVIAEKRFINLSAVQDGNMVVIHVENSCQEKVALKNGLPKSQRDPRYHGFGMKSMERIAVNYGGSVAAKTGDETFDLDILLLIPEDM